MIDFETAVGTDVENAKMRIDTVDVIRITLKSNPHQRKLYKFRKQLTKLREENDIGNNTAILNKDDYSQSTEEFIESLACFAVLQSTDTVKNQQIYSMNKKIPHSKHVSYLIIPRLFVQRKLHKMVQKVGSVGTLKLFKERAD